MKSYLAQCLFYYGEVGDSDSLAWAGLLLRQRRSGAKRRDKLSLGRIFTTGLPQEELGGYHSHRQMLEYATHQRREKVTVTSHIRLLIVSEMTAANYPFRLTWRNKTGSATTRSEFFPRPGTFAVSPWGGASGPNHPPCYD